jgi:hypothetical protein
MQEIVCPECGTLISGSNSAFKYSSRKCPGCGEMPYPAAKETISKIGYFLILFPAGIVGFCFIIFAFGSMLSKVSSWIKITDWEKTPAIIKEFSAEDVKNTQGVKRFQLKVLYTYEYQGKKYSNNSVTISSMTEEEQQEISIELRALLNDGNKTECYVNPKDPTKAVLRPYFSAESVLSTIILVFFPGLFCGLIPWGIFYFRTNKKILQLAEKHPDEPWKWNPEHQGIIQKNYYGYIGFWIISIFTFVFIITAPFLVFWNHYPLKNDVWFCVCFTFFSLLGIITGVLIRNKARSGKVPSLTLSNTPICPGTSISGAFYLPELTKDVGDFRIYLSCDKGKKYHYLPILEMENKPKSIFLSIRTVVAEGSCEAHIIKDSTTVNFNIEIPPNIPETIYGSEEEVTWAFTLMYGKGLSVTEETIAVPVFDLGDVLPIPSGSMETAKKQYQKQREEKKEKGNTLIKRLYAGLAIIIFLTFSISTFFSYRNYLYEQSMLSVQAEILKSSYEYIPKSKDPYYKIEVEFQYKVDGKSYLSTDAGTDTTTDDKAEVETLMKKYAPGNTVTAFYDPANPKVARLAIRTESGLLSSLVLAVFVVLALYLMPRILLFLDRKQAED